MPPGAPRSKPHSPSRCCTPVDLTQAEATQAQEALPPRLFRDLGRASSGLIKQMRMQRRPARVDIGHDHAVFGHLDPA